MMRILLFGGFLGSGKTSVILQIAKQITAIRQETVAIIENEIGEAGIDDQLLIGSGLKVKPLFGGCVCCQITSDLVTAINEIAENLHPDWLVIEMTGLAVPGNVIKFVRRYGPSYSACKTVVIVDAARWPELKEVLEPLVVSQVQECDLIIINKIDLVGSELQSIIEDIKQLAGQAPLLTASATGELSLPVIEAVFGLE